MNLASNPWLRCRVCGDDVLFGSQDFASFGVFKAHVDRAFLDLCNPIEIGVENDRWLVLGHERCVERIRPACAWPARGPLP